MGDFTPDDVLKAINGACENGLLPVDLDGHQLELGGFLHGSGEIYVVDDDDMQVARFSITVTEIDDENDEEGWDVDP
jgi:hypothetical protein